MIFFMGKYDFDEIIERRGTDCFKWDALKAMYGREDVTPMWVADMDFRSPDFVMDVIGYLPNNDKHELTREIMERHHIDFMKMRDIAKEIPMSRSQVHRKYNEGLDALLEFKRIQKIIEESEDEYDTWITRKL